MDYSKICTEEIKIVKDCLEFLNSTEKLVLSLRKNILMDDGTEEKGIKKAEAVMVVAAISSMVEKYFKKELSLISKTILETRTKSNDETNSPNTN